MSNELLASHAPMSGRAPWAEAAQKAAEERFAAMGAPGRRDEYWKYTRPDRLTVVPPAANEGAQSELFAGIDALKLVFVDGVLRLDLSDALELDAVEITPLADVLADEDHWAAYAFSAEEARAHSHAPRPLAALNSARAHQGVALRVHGEVPRPILLDYRQEEAASDVLLRTLIKVESGSMTLLERGTGGARLNAVIEASIADAATLHHLRVQEPQTDRQSATGLFVSLGAGSMLKSFTLSRNGALTRNESVLRLTGDEGNAHIAGACLADGAVHHDDTVFITHDAVGCESRQVFKKVLKNGAVGVFQGKILVEPDAQKTDGYQISQGLMLDEDSQFLAKPELEIYADDVACSHGSTCGAVDEDQLFYMMSRGIPRRAAEDLVILSFLAEAIEEIGDDALKDSITATLAGWLGQDL